MIEAKIKVETFENIVKDNPFYGDVLTKRVFEESFYRVKDTRENIAPCGFEAALEIGGMLFNITINKYYLEYVDTIYDLECYKVVFMLDYIAYEVSVYFKNGELNSVSLSEWVESSDFVDGQDPDNIYYSDEHFISLLSYLS